VSHRHESGPIRWVASAGVVSMFPLLSVGVVM